MGVGPLLAIIVVFVLIVSTLSTVFLWVVAGVSFLALIALIIVAAKANRFTGPKVLIDDARERWNRLGDEPDEVVVKIEPKDQKDE